MPPGCARRGMRKFGAPGRQHPRRAARRPPMPPASCAAAGRDAGHGRAFRATARNWRSKACPGACGRARRQPGGSAVQQHPRALRLAGLNVDMSIRRRLHQWHRGWRELRWTQLRLGRWPCPACTHAMHVQLRADELAVRCLHCGASAVSQSIIDVISTQCPDLAHLDVLELSARGTLARWLDRRAGDLMLSEYMPGEPRAPGRGACATRTCSS